MKKTVPFFLLGVLLSVWGIAHAAVSPSTAAFLEKLNKYYYCLSREGIKSYGCSLDCRLTKESENKLRSQGLYDEKLWAGVGKFRFAIADVAGQPISVLAIQPAKSGDVQYDARLEKLDGNILGVMNAFFQFWKAFAMEPLNDPNDIKQGNLKFQREENGFRVSQTDPSGNVMTGIFDMKGKLLELTAPGAAMPMSIKPFFVNSQKGYLLSGLTLESSGVQQACSLSYGVQGKYWLPKTLVIRVRLPGITNYDVELVFGFSNYKVQP
jgi:hypothetical protein